MKTIFQMGMSGRMGQYNPTWPNPYAPSMTTPAPAVPAPPPRSVSRKLTDEQRQNLLAAVQKARADAARIASWIQASVNVDDPDGVSKLLGDRYGEYQQALADSVAQDELMNTLEWRLAQGGDTYVHDWEQLEVQNYQDAVRRLVEVVEGSPDGSRGPVAGSGKNIAVSGVIAASAFLTAILI